MCEKPRAINIKIEPRSTFTFTSDLPHIVLVYNMHTHTPCKICQQISRKAMSFQSYGTQETVKLLFVEGNVVTWQQDTFPRFW